MPISFGKPKEEDVVSLIAAKKYARAIEVLKAQLQKKGANPSLRMQLADVLILAGKRQEAVALLLPLADQYARDGFAAKAVSVLKKVQKVDPGRRDVEERLARQIEERQREASLQLPRTGPLIGMEEAAPEPMPEAGPSLEIGLESMAPVSAPVEAPAPEPSAPSPDETLPVDSPLVSPLLSDALPPPVLFEPTPALAPAPPEGEIEDYDLMYAGDGEEELEEEEIEVPAPPPAAEPMSAGQFADELMGLVDSVFQEFPGAEAATAAPPEAPSRGGSHIVVSPLFRDFAVDEMVAVIQGLKLLTYERGQVILREGQPGSSLYTLTSGAVRAFRRDPATGKQDPLADLKEGAFFGEMSILTGQPRTASIVALTRCELLELDRATLDGITRTHPHVWDVLREFAGKRSPRAQG